MGVILTKQPGAGGTSDHGILIGLLDDDHIQYILVDGSRGFSSTVSGIMPTESSHLVTKEYADTLSGTGQTNTASNLGAGEGVYAQKVGVDLQFKSLVEAGSIALTSDSDIITISGGAGEGASDHGELTGLDDDDHPQYHTDARGDARYYIESEVDTISGSLNDKIGTNEIEYITVSGTDITNKYVTLAYTPFLATEVALGIIGGSTQTYGVNYTVSGTKLSWDGLGLDGVLEAGDKFRIIYTRGGAPTYGINIVEDTTPQLGGDLDTNGHDILFGTDTISGIGTIITGDHGTASIDQVVNVCYGTGDPPASGTATEGALFIKYTA